MEYLFLTKFFLTITIIASHILFLILIVFFANFHIDHPKYNLDYFGITRLSKNPHFSLCSVFDCVDNMYYVIGGNIMILLVLFFQELIFVNKDIRKIFTKRCTSDLIYYPKLFSRIISSFSLIMSMMLFQPMRLSVFWKMDLADTIRPFWFIIPFLIGLSQVIKSLYFNYITNDELGGKLLHILFKGGDVPLPSDYLYGRGIYEKLRSPFRGGVIIMMLSCNTKWDIGRIIYCTLFFICMYGEAANEDKYFFDKFDSYKKYVRLVPYRFLNYSMLVEGKKKKEAIDVVDDKGKKEEEKNKDKKDK